MSERIIELLQGLVRGRAEGRAGRGAVPTLGRLLDGRLGAAGALTAGTSTEQQFTASL
jgi:hypothetical protein